jgi:TPR repeat protein
MYESGQGVPKDLVEAERWKSLARLCQSRNLKNCENLE